MTRNVVRLAAAVLASAPVTPLHRAAAAEGDPAPDSSRKTSFAVVPGPFYNPNQGLGLMVMPMLMFHPDQGDEVSPPSIVGLMGQYAVLPPLSDASTRYSWSLGSVGRLFVDEDRWRVVPIAAYFDLFRQFRGVGGDRTSTQFDYRQVGAIAIVQVLREVGFKHFYAGLLGGYTTFRTSTGNPANQEVLTNLGTGPDWSGQPNLGVVAQYDTKDDQYYPTAGLDGNVRLNGSFKSDQEYLLLVPSLNQYFSLIGGDRVVLAYRLFGQFGFGDLPLASYAYYGSRGTTLGYASGDYVDKMMAGAEVEARWLFSRRVGAEAGTGIGKVFPSFDEFGPQPWLPAVWASLTYQVMESKQMRARLTFALGKSGGALYAAVGQNF